MKVASVTSRLFAPFSKPCGAAETLVGETVLQNEGEGEFEIHFYGSADDEALKRAKEFKKCSYGSVASPLLIGASDCFTNFVTKDCFRKKKIFSHRYNLEKLCFIQSVSKGLAKERVDRTVFESGRTLPMALRVDGNKQRWANKWMCHMDNSVLSLYGCEEDMLTVVIRRVPSGEVHLGVNESEPLDAVLFYRDFVRLVSE